MERFAFLLHISQPAMTCVMFFFFFRSGSDLHMPKHKEIDDENDPSLGTQDEFEPPVLAPTPLLTIIPHENRNLWSLAFKCVVVLGISHLGLMLLQPRARKDTIKLERYVANSVWAIIRYYPIPLG